MEIAVTSLEKCDLVIVKWSDRQLYSSKSIRSIKQYHKT